MKPPAAAPVRLSGPGDAVVEKQCAGAHLGLEEAKVRRVVLHPDVLGEPDGGHRVEPRFADVSVVTVAHLGEVGQALLGNGVLRPCGLLLGQRDADWPSRHGARHGAPCCPSRSRRRAGGHPGCNRSFSKTSRYLFALRLLEAGGGVAIAVAQV